MHCKYANYAYNQSLYALRKVNKEISSPNNIRRVVFSPYGIIVVFHVPYIGSDNNIIKSVPFDRQIVSKCLRSKSYIPMFQAIVDKGFCSNIENVVFCVRDSIDGVGLTSRDWEESTLFHCSKVDTLQKRFKRLDSIIITRLDFFRMHEVLMHETFSSPFLVLSDVPIMRVHSNIIPVSSGDWYKNYTLRGRYYDLETNGGTLEQHLKAVKESIIEYRKQRGKVQNVHGTRTSCTGTGLSGKRISSRNIDDFGVIKSNTRR